MQNKKDVKHEKRKKSMNAGVQHIIDMPLLQYVFAENIQRFYAHKSLSKFYVSCLLSLSLNFPNILYKISSNEYNKHFL